MDRYCVVPFQGIGTAAVPYRSRMRPGDRGPSGRSFSSDPSKLKGQTFPDFVHPLFKRVESGVKGFIVKVKYVAQHEKSEKPVVTFHVEQHLLNRVTYGDHRT
jgi:hypothetical protein